MGPYALKRFQMWFFCNQRGSLSCLPNTALFLHARFRALIHTSPLFFFFKCLFILERASVSQGGAEREGDRGSEAGSALTAVSLLWGSISGTVRPWPELKLDTQQTEPPNVPRVIYLNITCRAVTSEGYCCLGPSYIICKIKTKP